VDGLTLRTKAGAGQVPLARDAFQLDELMHEACADAVSLARPHNINVNLGQCEALATVGDRHRMRQLLLNLTDNAIKYNQPSGSVALALRAVNGSAEISISNTGPGITPEMLPRIFDPFVRANPTRGEGVDGCGLGLSIARWIANAHGGQIKITSEPGQMTVARVILPISVQKDLKQKAEQQVRVAR